MGSQRHHTASSVPTLPHIFSRALASKGDKHLKLETEPFDCHMLSVIFLFGFLERQMHSVLLSFPSKILSWHFYVNLMPHVLTLMIAIGDSTYLTFSNLKFLYNYGLKHSEVHHLIRLAGSLIFLCLRLRQMTEAFCVPLSLFNTVPCSFFVNLMLSGFCVLTAFHCSACFFPHFLQWVRFCALLMKIIFQSFSILLVTGGDKQTNRLQEL